MDHGSIPYRFTPKLRLFSSKKKKSILILNKILLGKVQFPRKSYIEFLVGTGGEFSDLSRRALNTLLPPATSYLCETGFLAVATIKTQYHSMMHLENDLTAAISELHPRYKSCSKGQPQRYQ
jgi:hypothetical protein